MPKNTVTSAHFAGGKRALGAGQRMKCRGLSAHMEFADLFLRLFKTPGVFHTFCLPHPRSNINLRWCIRYGISKDKRENEPSYLAAAGYGNLMSVKFSMLPFLNHMPVCILKTSQVAAETLTLHRTLKRGLLQQGTLMRSRIRTHSGANGCGNQDVGAQLIIRRPLSKKAKHLPQEVPTQAKHVTLRGISLG